MRATRLLPLVLTLAAVPLVPAAPVFAVQVNPVDGQPLDPNYADQIEQDRRDERRNEDRARHEQEACEFGCVDHEGLQARDFPGTPFVAVLHQAGIDDGVLTLRLRFFNDGNEPARLAFDPASAFESSFISAGGEKLFMLRDEDGELEAKEPLDVDVKPGEMESWWAKFPAPPAGTASFDLEMPPIESFRNVRLPED